LGCTSEEPRTSGLKAETLLTRIVRRARRGSVMVLHRCWAVCFKAKITKAVVVVVLSGSCLDALTKQKVSMWLIFAKSPSGRKRAQKSIQDSFRRSKMTSFDTFQRCTYSAKIEPMDSNNPQHSSAKHHRQSRQAPRRAFESSPLLLLLTATK